MIKLHVVFCVKCRKKLLKDILNEEMLEIILEICEQKSYWVDAMQSDIDNVAHQIKQISTFRIYKKHKEY